MAIKALAWALVVGMSVSGCAAAGPFGIGGLNKEQIEALAKVKDASVLCVEADVMLGGVGSLVVASVDKGIAAEIVVDARGKCAVTFRVYGPAPK